MNEKIYLENILVLTKSLVNLYMYGTVESCNKNVRKLLEKKLNSTLDLQKNLFNYMQDAGFYKLDNVKESEIKKLLNKICKA